MSSTAFRVGGRVVSMAVLVACGVGEQGQRGLGTPSPVVSDANKGLIAAIRESFSGASWQRYRKRFQEAIEILEESLAFYASVELDARKISSTNMPERQNKEIRRRTSVVGRFPIPDSYLRLVTTYLMEYAEDSSGSRAYLNSKPIQTLLLKAA